MFGNAIPLYEWLRLILFEDIRAVFAVDARMCNWNPWLGCDTWFYRFIVAVDFYFFILKFV